jgi:uncharacterized membrane protein
MFTLSRQRLLRRIDAEKVKQAIIEAEKRTSGEIRVSVSPFFWGNVQRVAERAFDRLGMTRTKDSNAILFFIVPARKRFAVIGANGIHEKVGQDFWHKVVAAMANKFRAGHFTEGLIAGIEQVGESLATYFPYDPASDVNELSDDVDFSAPSSH